jgi:hypothetical protein
MARFDGRAILVSKDDPQMQSDRSLIDPSRRSSETMRREIANSCSWHLAWRTRNTEDGSSENVGLTSTSLVKP